MGLEFPTNMAIQLIYHLNIASHWFEFQTNVREISLKKIGLSLLITAHNSGRPQFMIIHLASVQNYDRAGKVSYGWSSHL